MQENSTELIQAQSSNTCPFGLCDGSGWMEIYRDGLPVMKQCKCMAQQKSLHRLRKSGILPLVRACRFDTYNAPEQWQKEVKDMAIKYAKYPDEKWFFIGGQVGSGKTHLCTAIVASLIRRGYEAKYMLWRDEMRVLKDSIRENEYCDKMEFLKQVPVLYIDDFFYSSDGRPTAGDINIAFELINMRYINKLITIISSEYDITQITDISESVGSRIYIMAKKGSCINITPDVSKNYRLKAGGNDDARQRQ